MGLICNIHKERFIQFANSLEEKKDGVEEDGVMEFVSSDGKFRITFHTFTIKFDDGGFVGGNWNEALNKIFKTNNKGD